MKISVEIDDSTVQALLKITGETKKGPAIAHVAENFVRTARLQNFADRVMEGDYKDAFDEDYDPDRFQSLAQRREA